MAYVGDANRTAPVWKYPSCVASRTRSAGRSRRPADRNPPAPATTRQRSSRSDQPSWRTPPAHGDASTSHRGTPPTASPNRGPHRARCSRRHERSPSVSHLFRRWARRRATSTAIDDASPGSPGAGSAVWLREGCGRRDRRRCGVFDIVGDIAGVWDGPSERSGSRGRSPSGLPSADESLALELYPGLRRFAAVVAPAEVAPDDLVQEALVAVLRRGALSDLEDPGAYLRRTMLNLASNHRRRFGRARRALVRLRGGESAVAADAYPSDLADLTRLTPVGAGGAVPASRGRSVTRRRRRRPPGDTAIDRPTNRIGARAGDCVATPRRTRERAGRVPGSAGRTRPARRSQRGRRRCRRSCCR